MPKLTIGNREIGPEFPPVVIAELGINHGGNLEAAFEIVDAAASVGVEILKHQTHVVDDEMSKAARKVVPGHCRESIYDIMAACALSEEEERQLKEYVEKKGMIFLSTPFSRMAADRLQRFGVSAFKIGSGECNNYPLLKHIAGFGKPVILSTGMNGMEAVRKAVNIFESLKVPYALLHTTNVYPTPPQLVRLGAMVELSKEFPGVVYGLSDHTTDNVACLGAIALGASIVERHFIDKMERIGPDIICSMDSGRCRELISQSRILFQEMGGRKTSIAEEQATMDFAFATLVTIADVAEGELLTPKNLWVKRPGKGGVPAEQYESVLGKVALRHLPCDTHLLLGDFS